jgi:hypothetical protein
LLGLSKGGRRLGNKDLLRSSWDGGSPLQPERKVGDVLLPSVS